jgi:signal peptidase I
VLFVNKALYGAQLPIVGAKLPAFREPRRSDVVIFESVEEANLTVVKRIIGMPGDTIQMRANRMFLNGVEHDEPYVVRSADTSDYSDPRMFWWQRLHVVSTVNVDDYRPTLKNWGPVVVPPDSFLVMGDNRDNSLDSRYWGFLGRDRIRGRAAIIYYSHDANGILPLTYLTAIRWSRLFTMIR